jgi:hypothetical protein
MEPGEATFWRLRNLMENFRRQALPTIRNVAFEIVTWAPSQADVDLSIACMFEREMPGAQLAGGLLQLDEAFGGALTRQREEGAFAAHERETLLIRKPPASVQAQAVLLMGMGDPTTLSSAVIEGVLRVAFHEAVRFGASTVAFAPSLLDAGLANLAPLDLEAAMVRGVLGALRAEQSGVRKWVFDAGAAHFDAVAKSFLRAFEQFG